MQKNTSSFVSLNQWKIRLPAHALFHFVFYLQSLLEHQKNQKKPLEKHFKNSMVSFRCRLFCFFCGCRGQLQSPNHVPSFVSLTIVVNAYFVQSSFAVVICRSISIEYIISDKSSSHNIYEGTPSQTDLLPLIPSIGHSRIVHEN